MKECKATPVLERYKRSLIRIVTPLAVAGMAVGVYLFFRVGLHDDIRWMLLLLACSISCLVVEACWGGARLEQYDACGCDDCKKKALERRRENAAVAMSTCRSSVRRHELYEHYRHLY